MKQTVEVALSLFLACLVYLVAMSGTISGARAAPKTTGTTTFAPIDIVKRSVPAVVRIHGLDASGSEVVGSGFIIDGSGLIVTNLHVVSSLKTASVRLANGDTYDMPSVRGFDERKDIAVLKVAGFGLPSLPLGNSDSVEVGQRVVLIGNPLDLDASVTTGVVSGIRTLEEGYRVLQTDAAANPGNSGGPLIDESGRAIGVLTFKIRGAENLNFVVPINYVRGLLSDSTTLTLGELRTRLVGAVPTLSRSGFPTRWKSLNSGTTKTVRIDGEHIYVETILPEEAAKRGDFSVAELRKDSTGYVGVGRAHWACPKVDFWGGGVVGYSWCTEESPFRITLFSPTRIEGETVEYGQRDKVNCTTCKHSTKWRPASFTWIPE